MRQLGIRILNAALLTLCSFQVAEAFNRIAAEGLRSPAVYHEARATASPDAGSAWNERRIILDRNLFGAQIIALPSVSEPTEPVEETKLPLVLEATISAAGESYSRAAIRDSRSQLSMVLGVGDPVIGHAGVSVAVIERGRVLLLNAGRREELLLDEGSPSVSPDRPSTNRRRSRRAASTSRQPRGSWLENRSRTLAPSVDPAAEASAVSELTRRVRSGELTSDQVRRTIRQQLRSGDLDREQFGDLLAELANEAEDR